MEALVLGLRLVNGLLTVGFLPLLLRIYNRNKKRFYLLWGTGFFLYGVHIVVRVFLPLLGLEASTNVKLLSYFVQLTGFGLIIVGIGDLVDRTRQLLYSWTGPASSCTPSSPYRRSCWSSTSPHSHTCWAGSFRLPLISTSPWR